MWVWAILAGFLLLLVGPIIYFERQREKIERERHYGKQEILKRMVDAATN